MKLKYLHILQLIMLLPLIGACADDMLLAPDSMIPEGEGDMKATVTFNPNSGVCLGGTRAAGDAVKSIESICVLVYDTEGKLVKVYSNAANATNPVTDFHLHDQYDVDGEYNDATSPDAVDGKIGDKANEHQAEAKTPKADFRITGLPFGRYRIYAVANMGDLSLSPDYADVVSTEEGLKTIKLTWKDSDIALDNAMFGYFTSADSKKSEGFGDDSTPIVFKTPDQEIHSWIKRAVSKVTVAYDASGLKDRVWIYIKNVTIHDIPSFCYLGKNNTITSFDSLLNRKTDNSPFAAAYDALPNTRIDYTVDHDGSTNVHDKSQRGLELFNGLWTSDNSQPEAPAGSPVLLGSDHSETADALYFFENNQGNFQGIDRYCKVQYKEGDDAVGDNIRVDENGNDYKDRRPYGTYIEVEAYYVSANNDNPGSGNIKYRFMLGKDVLYDYNAQRNYHFKLTLGFNGWANQPDWHIDYDHPKPALEVPDVFRVSYLYHQKHMMPIRISGNCEKLEVRILENNWAPYDPVLKREPTNLEQPLGADSRYAFKWNEEAFSNLYNTPQTVTDDRGITYSYNSRLPQLGFLALNMPNNYDDVKSLPASIPEATDASGTEYIMGFNDGERAWTAVDGYYSTACGTGSQANVLLENQDLEIGEYTRGSVLNNWKVSKAPLYEGNRLDDEKIVEIPLWTRAKTIIDNAGFSGNNPYEYFERKATLEVKATFKVGEETQEIVRYVTVLQVPRIVNPKGIWKKSDSKINKFHVVLTQAASSYGKSDYTSFRSDGEWTASVEVGSCVKLSTSGTTVGKLENGVIKGRTGTPIDFNIEFTGVGSGIVTVMYHGNNCVHKIFVRKGYEDPVFMGGNYWSSYSLYRTEFVLPANRPEGEESNDTWNVVLTKNPLSLGSFFKHGRAVRAILVKNNNVPNLGPMMDPGNTKFEVVRKINDPVTEFLTWNDKNLDNSPKTPDYNTGGFGGWGYFYGDVDGKHRKYKIPEYQDFENLRRASQFGFGVFYGNGADETKTTWDDVTGMQDSENTGDDYDLGVRGVMVYNPENADQILFPIGKNGMGCRRVWYNKPAGSLWYGDVTNTLDYSKGDNRYRPVPYNMPIMPGAIYWIDKIVDGVHGSGQKKEATLGWDVNYFNYDFNSYSDNNYRDACPIKFILVNYNPD